MNFVLWLTMYKKNLLSPGINIVKSKKRAKTMFNLLTRFEERPYGEHRMINQTF